MSEMQVGAIYAESMMTILDTISDRERNNKMTYVEFLVFLCRIAHEHYESTPYKNELNYLKLDHLMPSILNVFNLTPAFLFNEKFEIEAEIEMKKLLRRKRKLEQRRQGAIAIGVPVDPALTAEIARLDEELQKSGMDHTVTAAGGSDSDDVESDEEAKQGTLAGPLSESHRISTEVDDNEPRTSANPSTQQQCLNLQEGEVTTP